MGLSVLKNRMTSFVAAYVALFMILAVCGYYALGKPDVFGSSNSLSHGFASDMVYFDLPRMTVSIGGGGSAGGGGPTAPRVRLDIALEIAGKDADIMKGYQPRIMDKLNNFLGTLRADQIQSSSLPMLREELLKQVNSVGAPVPVHDVMFRQLVVM